MQTKSKNVVLIIVTGMLILSAISSIGFYASQPQPVVAAGGNAVVQSLSVPENVSNVSPEIENNDVLSKTVKDVTVEITSAKIIDTGVEIGICYTTLDGGEWYPTPGHLFYGTYEVFPDEYEFTTEEKANENKLGKRCALIRYRIDDLETITTPIGFSLIDVAARPREMSACKNFQERFDTSSKAKAYGLKAKCAESNDGGFVVTLADHKKSITKDDANKLLDEIVKGEVVGPWEFIINEIEK